MIEFRKFSKYYNGNLIIQADMMLNEQFYWLKGENGSGKTTLFRSIAGLIPFDGYIGIDGVDIRTQKCIYRSMVGYAEAEPVYPAFLTGMDLINFYRDTKQGKDGQLDDLVAAMGIGGYINNKVGTYSSGMLKKLSLVLGFIGSSTFILLDEPLITLDVASVANLIQLIELYIKQGVCFMVTSHQQLIVNYSDSARLAIVNKTLSL